MIADGDGGDVCQTWPSEEHASFAFGQLASPGRTTIGRNLNMIVSEIPYQNDADIATVAIAIDNMVKNLKGVQNLTWIYPPLNQTGADYLKTVWFPTHIHRSFANKPRFH